MRTVINPFEPFRSDSQFTFTHSITATVLAEIVDGVRHNRHACKLAGSPKYEPAACSPPRNAVECYVTNLCRLMDRYAVLEQNMIDVRTLKLAKLAEYFAASCPNPKQAEIVFSHTLPILIAEHERPPVDLLDY